MRSLIAALAAALFVAPSLLPAQYMPTRVIRRGANMGFELSDGEPISYFLEHARHLQLTEEQKLSLMNIRRRLRQVNAPFVRQLDSLREAVGLSLEPRPRLQQSDHDAFERFQKISQPVVDSIRVNNQAALGEARIVLIEAQRATLDSLIRSERDTTPGRGRRPPPPSRR
jgi:hypothetical protein